MKFLLHINLFILSLCCFCSFSIAQTITKNRELSFGKIILTNNNSSKKIILLSSGDYTADPEYIFFNEPQLGNVTVDGYLPGISLNVNISNALITAQGGGINHFLLRDSYTIPSTIITDSNGSATFDIGATLLSDGSGTTMGDSNYLGNFIISITD